MARFPNCGSVPRCPKLYPNSEILLNGFGAVVEASENLGKGFRCDVFGIDEHFLVIDETLFGIHELFLLINDSLFGVADPF
jgi:hypothetical protein